MSVVDNATKAFNPLDIFWQAYQGNWVAWFAIGLFGVCAGLFMLIIVAWFWKMPQYAKAGFINNLWGGNKPTIGELYENKRLVFRCINLFRSGIGYLKGVWFLFPKAWATSQEELTKAESDLLNSVCTIDGTQSAFYLNQSVQAQVCNPELLAVFQHAEELQELTKKKIQVKKEVFIEALQKMSDKFVELQPVHLQLPIDIKNLRTMMPKSLSKSELAEQENRIKRDVREQTSGLNLQIVIVIIGVIGVIIGIVGLLKLFAIF